MTDIDSQISYTILLKQFKKLRDEPLINIGCTVGLEKSDDIYNWKCTIDGPRDSPYKDGTFIIFIKFHKNFPTVGPKVIFDTPIYHLNINPTQNSKDPLGFCCINTVNFWTPDTSIEDLINSIFGLFYVANEDGAYGLEYKDEFRHKRELYNKKVRYFTQKFAGDNRVSSKELNLTKWNFDVRDDFNTFE